MHFNDTNQDNIVHFASLRPLVFFNEAAGASSPNRKCSAWVCIAPGIREQYQRPSVNLSSIPLSHPPGNQQIINHLWWTRMHIKPVSFTNRLAPVPCYDIYERSSSFDQLIHIHWTLETMTGEGGVELWEWISNFLPHFIIHVIVFSC